MKDIYHRGTGFGNFKFKFEKAAFENRFALLFPHEKYIYSETYDKSIQKLRK